jgi:hypothetical protein
MLIIKQLERTRQRLESTQIDGNKHSRLPVDTVQTEGVLAPKSFTRPPRTGETLVSSGTLFLQAGYGQTH